MMTIRTPAPDYPSKFAPSYRIEWAEFRRTIGGDYLRRVEGTDAWPTQGELGAHILAEAWRLEPRGVRPGTSRAPRIQDHSYSKIIDECHETAGWLLAGYEKAKAPFSKAQCRRGGARSRRTRKDVIARYRALQRRLDVTGEVLSKTEMSKRLGIDRSTLYRLIVELRPTPVEVIGPPRNLLDLLDDEFPETSEFRRPIVSRILDQRPDIRAGFLTYEQFLAEMLADFAPLPPLNWGVAA